MKGEATYHVEEGEYVQIKVKSFEDAQICMTFKMGTHLWGQAFNSPDSTIALFMPADFKEELSDLLRTLATQLDAMEP